MTDQEIQVLINFMLWLKNKGIIFAEENIDCEYDQNWIPVCDIDLLGEFRMVTEGKKRACLDKGE